MEAGLALLRNGHRIPVWTARAVFRKYHPVRHRKMDPIDEVYGFLDQSNISAKNIRRLETLRQSAKADLRELAGLVLEVARHFPRRRRRYVRMFNENRILLKRLKACLGGGWWDDLCVQGAFGIHFGNYDALIEAAQAPELPNVLETTTDIPNCVTVHTDGACQRNPGPGGWAAILRYGKHVREICGGEPATTNNRMELHAALAALRALKRPCAVEIFTDSKYLRDGITQWLARWKANGWRTIDRTPVKNQDLWMQLDGLCARHQVTWKWLKGHAGHHDNERCDELARAEIGRMLQNPSRVKSDAPVLGSPTVQGSEQGKYVRTRAIVEFGSDTK